MKTEPPQIVMLLLLLLVVGCWLLVVGCWLLVVVVMELLFLKRLKRGNVYVNKVLC